MAKSSRNGPRYSGSKKKQKKRPVQQSVAQAPSSSNNQQPVQSQAETIADNKPSGESLQFRPRARGSAAPRSVASRAGSSARASQQVVDYSYVYTDLRIIGGLSAVLIGGLVALSFIL
jgi:hypothetical protein